MLGNSILALDKELPTSAEIIVSRVSMGYSLILGVEEALNKLSALLKQNSKNLYLVLSISRKGWNGNFYPYLKEVRTRVYAKGFINSTAKHNIIKIVRNDFKVKMIILPGIGAQEAKVGDTISSETDYEFVGRASYEAKNPIRRAKILSRMQEVRVNECKRAENR